MSLYGSLLFPERPIHSRTPASLKSFSFNRFRTLCTLLSPQISRNSSQINRLRTLCKKIGEWGTLLRRHFPFSLFHFPISSLFSRICRLFAPPSELKAFIFKGIPPLCVFAKTQVPSFQEHPASCRKKEVPAAPEPCGGGPSSICMFFVLSGLQIPLPATPLFCHLYKTARCAVLGALFRDAQGATLPFQLQRILFAALCHHPSKPEVSMTDVLTFRRSDVPTFFMEVTHDSV